MGEKIMKSGRNKEKIIELISNFPVIPGHRDSGCGLKKRLMWNPMKLTDGVERK
ncbi:hypothetical protein ABID24_002602 [Blautia caecimuris]|uniref:Uncharacterized protein n=1 Tax=Blautia caecimuris TaxID=1796615 RepID=A0ABV2M4E7_9FIRM|nr:hypothetical protein [Blautia caecimuris]MCR2002812.1 hypothetical protein [Blautia caecimuris]